MWMVVSVRNERVYLSYLSLDYCFVLWTKIYNRDEIMKTVIGWRMVLFIFLEEGIMDMSKRLFFRR